MRQRASWRKKYYAYRKDSLSYVRALAKHQEAKEQYGNFLQQEHEEAKAVLVYLESFSNQRLVAVLDQQLSYLRDSSVMNTLEYYSLIAEIWFRDLTIFQNEYGYNFSLEIPLVEELHTYDRQKHIYSGQYRSCVDGLSTLIEREKEGFKTIEEGQVVWKKRFAIFEQALRDLLAEEKSGFTEGGQQKYWALKMELEQPVDKIYEDENRELLFDGVRLGQTDAQLVPSLPILKTDSLAAEIRAKKARYGIEGRAIAATALMTDLKIYGFGYINCDRFPLRTFSYVKVKLLNIDQAAQYFVLRTDINGLERPIAAHQTLSFRLPKKSITKVVGIKCQDGQYQFGLIEGKGKELRGMNIMFESLTKEELQTRLRSL